MPEYLAPGVYVEETSFRSKSIEGVSTSTTAFVGLARKGLVTNDVEKSDTPEILTSYVDFERVFGGFEDIELTGGSSLNYLAHAVSAFFANGGSRLYVARVAGAGAKKAESATFAGGTARFKARFEGSAGNGRIILSLGYAPISARTWASAPVGTVVRVGGAGPTPARVTGAVVGEPAASRGSTITSRPFRPAAGIIARSTVYESTPVSSTRAALLPLYVSEEVAAAVSTPVPERV